MGGALPAGYVEVRRGVYERIDTIKRRKSSKKTVLPIKGSSGDGKPKRVVRNEPLAKNEGKKENSGRVHVRITVFRKRLTDPDNNNCKWIIDCLRYSGVLRDDREEDVTLEIRQEKTRGQEETLIELFHHESGAV
jgi:hypothetical protein